MDKPMKLNLQDTLLEQVKLKRIPVSIVLTKGLQLKGIILGFDIHTVIIDSFGTQQTIYKHTIATITPMKPVQLIPKTNTRA